MSDDAAVDLPVTYLVKDDPRVVPIVAVEVGRTYPVVVTDCCIEGSLSVTVTGIRRDEDGDLDVIEHTCGVLGPGWSYGGAWALLWPECARPPATG